MLLDKMSLAGLCEEQERQQRGITCCDIVLSHPALTSVSEPEHSTGSCPRDGSRISCNLWMSLGPHRGEGHPQATSQGRTPQ